MTSSTDLPWKRVFDTVAPLMIDEASEDDLRRALSDTIDDFEHHVTTDEDGEEIYVDDFEITDAGFQRVKVQLRALGLIAKSSKQRSLRDRRTYWSLTPYGDEVMTTSLAAKKPDPLPF